MADNLVSCDQDTGKIYEHDGFSSTILSSFDFSSPDGLAWDGNHLYCCDYNDAKAIKYDGVSSTVLDSFVFSNSHPSALTWIDPNLISCRPLSIYKHDGFSSTILQTLSAAYGTDGLAWDGANLYSCEYQNGDITKFDGFSTNSLGSISVGSSPFGLTWWEPNLITCDYNADKIYKLDGFSSTILESFSSPDTTPSGLTHTYSLHPTIASGELATDNTYCKIVFSAAIYSDINATQTINKDDLALIFTQNGGDATGASITGLYADSALTTPLVSGIGYDTVYAKLSITGLPTGTETIEIRPASGSSIYDVSGIAMPDTETTGALSLYNAPVSIISGVMANDNAYVEIDFSEAVWADSGNTSELTPDSFLVDFQQNGGGISAASINALFQDAGLTTPLASGAGYSTVFAQLLVTSGFATGDETIEIKPKDGSSIYDSSGGAMDAAETTGLLYFHSVGSAVSLNWSTLDPVISALRSIISLFLVSLFGHGLHVFFTDKALFQEVENDLHTRISSLPTNNQALGIELLNFFQRYYGK